MIVGIVGIVIGAFFAWYCWTHESPKLRKNRIVQDKKTREEHQASQEALIRGFRETQESMIQKFDVMMKTTVASEVQKALENYRRTHEPDKPITAEEREVFAVIAEASGDSVIQTLGSAAILFEPLMHGSMGTDRLKEEPPKESGCGADRGGTMKGG
jgi:hypothetical protein